MNDYMTHAHFRKHLERMALNAYRNEESLEQQLQERLNI
jgi:hypothetical protein